MKSRNVTARETFCRNSESEGVSNDLGLETKDFLHLAIKGAFCVW